MAGMATTLDNTQLQNLVNDVEAKSSTLQGAGSASVAAAQAAAAADAAAATAAAAQTSAHNDLSVSVQALVTYLDSLVAP